MHYEALLAADSKKLACLWRTISGPELTTWPDWQLNALKSCLAAEVKQHDFPDRDFVSAMYVHNLEKLFRLNGALWLALQNDMKIDQKLSVNWSTVKDWDDSKRYAMVQELEARALYDACSEAGSGVIEWIKEKW